MDQLLDTHTLIWFIEGDEQLSGYARESIESRNANNFVSIASLWEIAIKICLGKLKLGVPFSAIAQRLDVNNFQILPITFDDTLIVSSLPFHHRDPFDRIMIAQSLSNKMHIITKDGHFKDYGVSLIW